MNCRAYKLAGRVARKLCVSIEGYHITHLSQQRFVGRRFFDEAGIRSSTQQPIKLFQLSSLAFPTYPSAFTWIPLPATVKQMEAVRLSIAMAIVEFCDSGFSNFE
jgi:hypothetical protein